MWFYVVFEAYKCGMLLCSWKEILLFPCICAIILTINEVLFRGISLFVFNSEHCYVIIYGMKNGSAGM